MKRLGSSDSFGALISISPPTEEIKGFQSMLEGFDEEELLEESNQNSGKKRRLRVDQVKALEKNFEVENKLEPERKLKLAKELELQPRQIAIWFQNRRARSKTKRLERDFGNLKADYENLKLNFDSLQQDKETLLAELKDLNLKMKFKEEKNTVKELSIEEILISESENEVSEQSKKISTTDPTMQEDCFNNNNGVDSDSSAILNEDNNNNNNNSPNAGISSSGFLQQHQFDMLPTSSSLRFNSSSSAGTQKSYQHKQLVRMEDYNFGAEETCNFFSAGDALSLQWYYCSDEWN